MTSKCRFKYSPTFDASDNFAMKTNQKKMIAAIIKEGRAAKGYTQKELSELSNISIRSIQRIENGEIVPRNYTLKTLSEVLSISFETIHQAEPAQKISFKLSKPQKIILSIGIPLLVFFGCWAFIAQSRRFPETVFELLLLVATGLLITTVALLFIWRKES
jgi:transcriptional regulator with XRE-family HTH domain